jgi:hypothetical protein
MYITFHFITLIHPSRAEQNMAKKTSDIIVKGSELIAYIKRLIKEGNVRRLIIKKKNGNKVLEIPLSAGVGIGGLLLVLVPVIVAISSVAAWMAEFRVEVLRNEEDENDGDGDD